MSLRLPLLAAITAALTWNLERPVYRHKWGHALSFVLGWLVGELAPFVVAVEVLLVLAEDR